ncbi:amidase [Pandoraea sp. PE-S2R-1]|uniref:amidase n=1 Tax=Pandoraea sp. PE-S2R-1 TaxID=1986994 RepID=UPI0014835665|nr:amidase [Pandoraea sp. PE-S2R-1]
MKLPTNADPALLSISAAAASMADGSLDAETLLMACLARIGEREATVGAWAHLDIDRAIEHARRLDRMSRRGPLHGIPVGIKDVIDTGDMPTTYGSPIYARHRPAMDAACVRRLRNAGAIVLGKTVSTEFAAYHPGKTTHPFNAMHSPGGSSSGSAAAVADCHVGLTLGTQTAGSVIRPASFNGVIGYKPSVGAFDYGGVKPLAPSLDTLGMFVRDIDDLTLVQGVLGDAPTAGAVNEPRPPRIALCRTDRWVAAQAPMREAVERCASSLAAAGAVIEEVVLPQQFDALHTAHQIIMSREAARGFSHEFAVHKPQLSVEFVEMLQAGLNYSDADEDAAWRQVLACRDYFSMVMRDFDAMLTVACAGEAPRGLAHTGSPVFNRIWTLLGLPCLTYPVGLGPMGLPLGVQVVGERGSDAALLACAAWMFEHTGVTLLPPDLADTCGTLDRQVAARTSS